jgi:acyl-CoA synthetase (AMP-forming)/AMP-acid ligase II
MRTWSPKQLPTRWESHFGDRVVRCFSERPVNVYEMFAAAVARNPDGEALVCGERRLTWRALHEAALRLAGGLMARGVGVGDRVALLLGNEVEFVVATLAAMSAGAVVVPVSVREQTPGITYILNHSRAVVVIHEAALGALLPSASETPHLRGRVSVGAFAGSEDYAALAEGPPLAHPGGMAEEATAAVLYTSGTTGHPKGAMLTHFNIVHSALHFEQHMNLGPGERAGVVVPMTHVTGLVALLVPVLRVAGTLLVMPAFNAKAFLAFAARERMTFTIMVPAMYKLCLLQEALADHDLSAWRVGGYGGAPMPLATIQDLAVKLPGVGLMNIYGSTETTSPAVTLPPGEAGAHGESVGLPMTCSQLVIVDEVGRELPRGQEGEIWIGGPMVAKGYLDNPAATAENFTGGYWHSGDIGYMNAEGYVYVCDRRKDMLNRGGFKIYSVEVENVLVQYPGVIEAAVVGRPCPVLGERVHVFVSVSDPGIRPADLIPFCAARLSDYKVPETFTVRTEPLPRNANGKLLKRELRKELLTQIGGEAA